MDLKDALWSSDGNNQSGGNGAWPQPVQPGPNPQWPSAPATNPVWNSGGSSGGGGVWPSQAINPPPNAAGGWPAPSPGPAPGTGVFPSAAQQNLKVPHEERLPRGVYDKLLMTICGTVTPKPNKITVDFCASNDVAFHFNPRFNEGGGKVIVRNSLINGNWGHEERELSDFPFVPGQPFEMMILCTNEEFKVAVNGRHMLSFRHRYRNLGAITQCNIYNDLTLSRVQLDMKY